MTISCRLIGEASGISPAESDLCLDENERFVRFHFCRYLVNLSENAVPVDSYFIESVFYILGEKAFLLTRKLEALLRSAVKRRFAEDLIEAGSDEDEIASATLHALKRSSARIKKQFLEHVIAMLNAGSKKLAAGPVPQLDRNIQKLSEMMRLNALEHGFLIFLVVVSFSEKAEIYLVDYLECNKFTKRRVLGSILGISRSQVETLLSGRLLQIGLLDSDNDKFELTDDYRKIAVSWN